MVMRVVTEAQKVCTTFFFKLLNVHLSSDQTPVLSSAADFHIITFISRPLYFRRFSAGLFTLQLVCKQDPGLPFGNLYFVLIIQACHLRAGHPLLSTCAPSHCSYLTHGFGNVPTFEFNYGTAPSETKKPLIAVCFSLSSLNAPAEADQQKVYATDTDSLREEKKRKKNSTS